MWPYALRVPDDGVKPEPAVVFAQNVMWLDSQHIRVIDKQLVALFVWPLGRNGTGDTREDPDLADIALEFPLKSGRTR